MDDENKQVNIVKSSPFCEWKIGFSIFFCFQEGSLTDSIKMDGSV